MDPNRRKIRDVQRFWSKVRKAGEDQCWLWTGTLIQGYGSFHVSGSAVSAHRYSYELHHGVVLGRPTKRLDAALLVRHTCDNPSCVNPRHLVLGTQADNIEDRDSKGRQSRGEGRYNRKLTDQAVREIRQKYKPRVYGIVRLAKEYGVDPSTIYDVVRGRIWKHVRDE